MLNTGIELSNTNTIRTTETSIHQAFGNPTTAPADWSEPRKGRESRSLCCPESQKDADAVFRLAQRYARQPPRCPRLSHTAPVPLLGRHTSEEVPT